MRYFDRADDDDRRRRLWNFSRYPEAPTRLVIEWTEDGTDYLSLGTFEEEQFSRYWDRLRDVCAGAQRKLTRMEIHEFPGFNSTMKRSDSLPPSRRASLCFAWRYRTVRL
jgi:hypothetical protein